MRRLVAAPDKFRGTATATEAAATICEVALGLGWVATPRPMSDGGEGFLAVLGGERRTTTVRGPLGRRVTAAWSVREDGTALVESAQAIGRAHVPRPRGDDPVKASTYGVGELLAAALEAGATRLVVGCGGSATTDGGAGCLEALDDLGVELGVPLVVACDVTARFLDAARGFGPQKGAGPEQVARLEARLRHVAATLEARFGCDVTGIAGAGAAGGLAGALVALGGQVVAGATYVAGEIGLHAALRDADVVVTGEGAVDQGTLGGKVVATVLSTRGELPALVVAGRVEPAVADSLTAVREGRTELVALDRAVQRRDGTAAALRDAVASGLAALR